MVTPENIKNGEVLGVAGHPHGSATRKTTRPCTIALFVEVICKCWHSIRSVATDGCSRKKCPTCVFLFCFAFANCMESTLLRTSHPCAASKLPPDGQVLHSVGGCGGKAEGGQARQRGGAAEDRHETTFRYDITGGRVRKMTACFVSLVGGRGGRIFPSWWLECLHLPRTPSPFFSTL